MSNYKALDTDKIIKTVSNLSKRISERFPESGLSGVCKQLLDISYHAKARTEAILKPIIWVRALNIFLIAIIVVTVIGAGIRFQLSVEGMHFFDFVQALEAGMNDVVLIGAGIFFLVTTERRIKRGRALDALNELRSIAHVIDMHQLTKDPERSMRRGSSTESSPKDSLSPYQLERYLDYCSEMLSLTGKLAALYIRDLDDSVVLQSVTEIENLTTALSQKIWQKIMILNESVLLSEQKSEGLD